MDSNTPSPDATTLARRRLIRGSFSVPAVLTLASGSALAATSATCLAKATATPSTAALANGTPGDTFLRVRLVQYTGVPEYAVTKASFGTIAVNSSFWTSGIAWQQFDINTNLVVGSPRTGSIPGSPSNSNYYVALRLNSAGEIVGVGASGSGSVVGSSCWTSMKMTAP